MFQELAINGKEREISLENKAKDILLFQLPKAPLQKGDPSKLQIKKKQLFRPRKVVFSFSLPDTLGSRHEAFQVPFPAAQSATAKVDPSNCKLKNNFSGSEKLFFPKV